jgi:hypothetical protein
VLDAVRNPFRAVTVAHAAGEESTTWYCANSFLYAVQGYEGDMDALRSGHPPVTVCTLLGGTHSIERCKSRES